MLVATGRLTWCRSGGRSGEEQNLSTCYSFYAAVAPYGHANEDFATRPRCQHCTLLMEGAHAAEDQQNLVYRRQIPIRVAHRRGSLASLAGARQQAPLSTLREG